jgi:hypothetical protein
MRGRQFAIRALLLGTLIAGVCGVTAMQWPRRTAPAASLVRTLDSGVDLASPPSLATPIVRPATKQPVSQIVFAGPEGASVIWDVTAPGAFDSDPLTLPGRYNFPSGAIYRLKLTNIPGHDDLVLYPTLEVAPPLPSTDAYLAHNAVPVQFTGEDFDQMLSGKVVTKVVYLPDPAFQELALAGVETLVSTWLDPGLDPIVEADHRGAILAIVRLGNSDAINRRVWVPGDVFHNRAPFLTPQ